MGVLVVCSLVGDALTTTLADTHPLALMMLNARNRVLVLVTNQVDALTFYGVGTLRLMLSDPLWFIAGYFYGDAAISWVEGRSDGFGRFLRWAEHNFGKRAWPFVIVAPNIIICLLAGAARMRIPVFASLNAVGTVGRLVLLRQVGRSFEAPIDDVLGFFARYRLPLFLVSVALVTFSVVNDRRRGRGELSAARRLAEEADADEDQGLSKPSRGALMSETPPHDPIAALNQVLSDVIDVVQDVKQAHRQAPEAHALHTALDELSGDLRTWADLLLERDEALGVSPLASMPSVAGRKPPNLFPDAASGAEVGRIVGEHLDWLGQHVTAALAEQVDDGSRAVLADVERGVQNHRRAFAEL
jgi:membrane protein DedA with SNARE-associated domain/DNA-binding ferritin-like protein